MVHTYMLILGYSPVWGAMGARETGGVGVWVALADLEGEISGAHMLILGYSPLWGVARGGETGGGGGGEVLGPLGELARCKITRND